MSGISHFSVLALVGKTRFVVVNINFTEYYLSYIKCKLDFPGKKANLLLALLNIFGGCAMLPSCTYYSLNETEIIVFLNRESCRMQGSARRRSGNWPFYFDSLR